MATGAAFDFTSRIPFLEERRGECEGQEESKKQKGRQKQEGGRETERKDRERESGREIKNEKRRGLRFIVFSHVPLEYSSINHIIGDSAKMSCSEFVRE